MTGREQSGSCPFSSLSITSSDKDEDKERKKGRKKALQNEDGDKEMNAHFISRQLLEGKLICCIRLVFSHQRR